MKSAIFRRLAKRLRTPVTNDDWKEIDEKRALLLGRSLSWQVRSVEKIKSLADVEFSVFSQWGEDGIIEWLVTHLPNIPNSFIEFGVEDYRESNTRFLLQNRNWRGLVIDGSEKNIATIKAEQISWRQEIVAVGAFVTRENINKLICNAGFSGEIGILSIDIDGNDFWIWEAIQSVSPHIVIIEYNANFGDILPLSVPYSSQFVRTKAHFSNLYFGASCQAMTYLGEKKGYSLVGSNLNGNNLFFVRNDKAEQILKRLSNTKPRMSRFRESRDQGGELSLLGRAARRSLIAEMLVVDVENNVEGPLNSFGDLFSSEWLDA